MSSTERSSTPSRGSVVVVHGLWMPGWETWLLRRRLEASGYHATSFVYPSVGVGLAANADALARFAAELEPPVHFVGHSLGGALIVTLFEHRPPPQAGRIVCLGSPLKGSRPGSVLCGNSWGRHMLGKSIGELLAAGGCGPWDNATDLGIIAGDVPFGFGRLLGGLGMPNDGTVAVEETQLAGATDHIVVRCTHTSLLWSRDVAERVIRFLTTGRFALPAEIAGSSSSPSPAGG